MKKTTNPPSVPLLPPGLKKGDTIGLAPLAGPWDDQKFSAGIRFLTDLGFKIRLPPDSAQSFPYLAGSDQYRLDCFHELWRDPEISAIMAVRGGYGCLRLIDAIDLELIKKHPKILVGFSDVTVLLNGLYRHTGLITFHGPMLTTLAGTDKESMEKFLLCLTRQEPPALRPDRLKILRRGTARGRLLGGNLTILSHLIGTSYEPSLTDSILFIEDIGEQPYRIDRMLTQLKLAGRFEGIRGLIVGDFTNCGDTELIWNRILELFGDQIPIWSNFPVGHGEQNIILPLGIEVEMDSESGSLLFRQPCIRE
jgi:muramoyltetrapeptide carboxypeptidase